MKNPSLIGLCILWLLKKEQVVMLLLALLVFLSGIGVVYSSFLTRQHYAELQELQKVEDELDGEYGRLLLEHSAWASYVRVEEVSREKLNMVSPQTRDMILVVAK